MTSIPDLSKITRVEVIDKDGRALVRYVESGTVSALVQDSERTLKIFLDFGRENSQDTEQHIFKALSKDINDITG